MTNVMLVEDQTIVREGLVRMLESKKSIRVRAQAGSIAEAVNMISGTDIDLVLLDLKLPDGNGLDCIQRLNEIRPDIKIVVLSTYDEYPLVQKALEAGVDGYLPKQSTYVELINAINSVMSGGKYLHPCILESITNAIRYRSVNESINNKKDLLTQKEISILARLAKGQTYAEIAQQDYLSERTIRRYTDTIFVKLSARDKAQAVAEAVRTGQLKLD